MRQTLDSTHRFAFLKSPTGTHFFPYTADGTIKSCDESLQRCKNLARAVNVNCWEVKGLEPCPGGYTERS